MSYDLGTAHGKIVLEYKSDKDVDKAKRDVDSLARKAKEGDSTFKKLGAAISALGKGAAIGGIVTSLAASAAQAGALLIQLLGMVPALASIASLSAALPAIFAGLIATIGVLKAAFAGVGTAITAAFDTEHPEKFNKALEKLSPSARKFALALREAVPQLKAIQQGIQEAFFRQNLQQFIPRIVAGLKSLNPQLQALATDFALLGREIATATVDRDRFWEFLDSAIVSVRGNLRALIPAIAPVVDGLLKVGEVGLPLFDRMGAAIGANAKQFGEWMQEIATSGQLESWIETALATLKTLGGIISNVGSILSSVFLAAETSGGGLLNTLEDITGQAAEFLNSSEGFDALVELFGAILELAGQLAPIILTLASALAKALGPAVQRLAEELGPILLDVVEQLAPAFGPLAEAIVDLLAAVAPLLPPIAKLVALLAGVLATAVSALTREFGPLIDIIGEALLGALEHLTPLIDEMAKGLPLAAEAGVALAAAFAPLMPVIVELGKTLADSLIEVMPELREATAELLPVFIEFATLMGGQLAESLALVVKLLPGMVKIFATVAPIFLQIVAAGLKLIMWLVEMEDAFTRLVAGIVLFIGTLVKGLVNGLIAAYNGVVAAGAAVIGWFQRLPGVILGFLQALPGMLLNLFVTMLQSVAFAIGFGAGLIVGFFTKLVPDILAALVALPGQLWTLFTNALTNAKNATLAGINAVVKFFRDLPARAKSGANSLGSQITAVARSAMTSFRNAISSGVNSLLAFFRNLPNNMRNALGNLGNLLYNSGVNIINGLIRGVAAGVNYVLNLINNLGSNILRAFNRALSIFSPSKEFKVSGEMIGEGLIDGLLAKMTAVRKTAEQLAATVIRPTVALPTTAGAIVNTAAPQALQRATEAASAAGRTFGPYHLEVDGKVLASIVIDTVTGNPKVVSKASAEGGRQATWTGSGRTLVNA